MFTGLNTAHVKLIASYWVRFSLRTGGGLIALLLVLITGISIAGTFMAPVESLMQMSPELGHTEGEAARYIDEISRSEQIGSMVRWVTGSEQGQVEYLLQTQPALLSVIWLVLLMFFPFVTVIGSFNQTAADIGSRGLRYVLLRTERPNIFFGRLLGTVLFIALSAAVLLLIVLLYTGFKLNIYPFGSMATWGVQGFVAMLLLALPYVAMCAWLSGMFDSAFASLAVCMLATGGPIIFIKMANAVTLGDLDLDWLERLIPWGWKYELLSGDMATRLLAYGVMLGFTAGFLLLGMRTFARRDL